MPIPALYSLIAPAQSVNRNSKRRRTTFLKVGVALCVIVLLGILFVFLQSSMHDSESEKTHFVSQFDNRNSVTSNSEDDGGSELPKYAPVQQDEEPLLPESNSKDVIEEEKSAAEALQCPTSVIDFVINATDAKDECDGLRKAFDKTCGGEHEEGAKHYQRRRLSDIEDDYNRDSSWGLSTIKRLVRSITPQPRRRLELEETDVERENLEEVEGDDVGEPAESNDEHKKKTPLSPTLPISSTHVSSEMAVNSLALNTDLEDIEKAIKEIGNATHSDPDGNSSNDSPHESKDSDESKAISTAVAVSAVINNPDVIENQSCCRSILQVFHDECDSQEGEEYADRRLFIIVCVIALCGMIKSLIRHFKIRWLPEAGGCILVGMVGGLFLKILPNIDFAFSHDMFLRLMVPPIGKFTFFPFSSCF